MSTYRVTIKAYMTVVVTDADHEESALEAATENVDFGDFMLDEAEAKEVLPADEESQKRHADKVLKAFN